MYHSKTYNKAYWTHSLNLTGIISDQLHIWAKLMKAWVFLCPCLKMPIFSHSRGTTYWQQEGSCPLATLISYPCTKFVVPSTGSMIHVGMSVKIHGSPLATDSSPMKLQQRKNNGPMRNIKYVIYDDIWYMIYNKNMMILRLCYKQCKHIKIYIFLCVCMHISHQCVPSPNSSLRDPIMIFSTLSSVLVTRSTLELFVMTLISLSPAFLIS